MVLEIAVAAATSWGDEVRLVGANKHFGSWRAHDGVALQTSPRSYPVWSTSIETDKLAGGSKEHKFVIIDPCGGVRWEFGPNRSLSCPSAGRSLVASCFGQANMHSEALDAPSNGDDRFVFLIIDCPDTSWGDDVAIVGNVAEFGAWDPANGIPMLTTVNLFPIWFGVARLRSPSEDVSWKVVVRRNDGKVEWENCPDRTFCFARSAPNAEVCALRASFGCWEISRLEPLRILDGGTRETRRRPVLSRKLSSVSTCSTGAGGLLDDLSENSANSPQDADSWELHTPISSPSLSSLTLRAGAHCRGKTGGTCEDAHFMSANALGVADGVGSMVQFASYGVDAAAYANELMEIATRFFTSGESQELQHKDGATSPEKQAALSMCAAENKATTFGAATMTVLHLAGSSVGVANLGDSGFMVLRQTRDGFKTIARSAEQQHCWNFPYQLMRVPAILTLPPGATKDSAADCECCQVPVSSSDLILLFTDGFTDNLHEHEILQVVNRVCPSWGSSPRPNKAGLADPEWLARELALAAWQRSVDRTCDSPFAIAARQQGFSLSGGKEDDITVVAAWVTS